MLQQLSNVVDAEIQPGFQVTCRESSGTISLIELLCTFAGGPLRPEVRQDILNSWGGLSVKDGFIQRSAVPPALIRPSQFLDWFQKQAIQLVESNN